MGTQYQRLVGFWLESLHNLAPQKPCGAEFGNLHHRIHADAEEEG